MVSAESLLMQLKRLDTLMGVLLVVHLGEPVAVDGYSCLKNLEDEYK